MVRGLGPLSLFSDFTGILSGRLRTDSLDNFASDMIGVPSRQDRQDIIKSWQRLTDPNWKPGDPITI